LDSGGHNITLLPTFIIERKAKFQLEGSANKAVIFFPSNFTDPLKSGLQARNSWPKQRKEHEEALKYLQLMSLHHSIIVYMLK